MARFVLDPCARSAIQSPDARASPISARAAYGSTDFDELSRIELAEVRPWHPKSGLIKGTPANEFGQIISFQHYDDGLQSAACYFEGNGSRVMKSPGIRQLVQMSSIVLAFASPTLAVGPISKIFGAPGFDQATGNGYKGLNEVVYLLGTRLAEDGTVLSRHNPFAANVDLGTTHSLWRADEAPTIFPAVPPNIFTYVHGLNNAHTSIGEHAGKTSRWTNTGDITSFEFDGNATDINDSGQMIAYFNSAMSWNSAGQPIELQMPPETTFSMALSINDAGQIAGAAGSNGMQSIPLRWEADGSATVLAKTLNTGLVIDTVEPNIINRHGAIAGIGAPGFEQVVSGGPLDYVGVYWSPSGDATALEHLPADIRYDVEVMDMNEHGEIIGFEEGQRNGVWSRRGVRWESDGTVVELERYPGTNESRSAWPLEINKFGYVVGSAASDSSDFQTAVLWSPDGAITILNTLRPPGSEWSFGSVATAISETGWVTGVGGFNPEGPAAPYTRAWSILIPEAGTYGLGDANFDEAIDFADLLIVAQNYGEETNGSVDMGDFDLDGVVGFSDLLTVAQNYESNFALLPNDASAGFVADWGLAQSMVPEPATLSLLTGGWCLLRRRR